MDEQPEKALAPAEESLPNEIEVDNEALEKEPDNAKKERATTSPARTAAARSATGPKGHDAALLEPSSIAQGMS